ncbi:MAG: hypothetical protein IPN38_17820 [Flavobacteriales bacterium]|nr:hypothetical protein [Flavobacteriales bacterium]
MQEFTKTGRKGLEGASEFRPCHVGEEYPASERTLAPESEALLAELA